MNTEEFEAKLDKMIEWAKGVHRKQMLLSSATTIYAARMEALYTAQAAGLDVEISAPHEVIKAVAEALAIEKELDGQLKHE